MSETMPKVAVNPQPAEEQAEARADDEAETTDKDKAERDEAEKDEAD